MRSIQTRQLAPGEREDVLAYLAVDARANLMLMDLVARVGEPPAPGEMRAQVVVAVRGDELLGVGALRPSVVFDAQIGPEATEALLPHLEPLGVGLVKSGEEVVDRIWSHLRRRSRRRAVIDRLETGYALTEDGARLAPERSDSRVRVAEAGDLDPLVYAARESLREESRPDPFSGDARGFRRWVRGRVLRARVVEQARRIVFVGYADVRRTEGWLLQGIYTWPEVRQRGFAAVGTSDLCREAFAARANHVQLAVVDGNEPALGLYEGLGFLPFTRLRTILFS
jgi:ribosomal protein S18 acetylase RimI-like enzyme